MLIVAPNIHSFLTKCLGVGVFLSVIGTTLINLSSCKNMTLSKREWSHTASTISRHRNSTCNPCEDFYECTCGQWALNNKPRANAETWSNYNVLKERTQTQLKDILALESKFSDSPLMKKIKQLYNACMNDDMLEKKGLLPLLELIQRIGHWPVGQNLNYTVDQISWLTAHYNYARITGEGALFNINVLPDAHHPTIYRIHILQPTSLFGQYRSIPEQKMSSYKNSLKSMVKALVLTEGIDISAGTIQRLIDDVVQFRQDLLKLVVVGEKSRDEGQLYNAMSIAELQNWNSLLAKKHNIIEINWLNVLTKTFKDARKVHFDQHEMIIVREYSYLRKLLLLLKETPARIIANHVHLHFVEMHLRYTTPEMRTLVADLHTSLTGAKPEDRRWYNCVQENEMKHLLASMYAEKHFPASNEKEVTDIFNNVRDTVRRMLQNSFLHNSTKISAIKKLQNIRAIIGHRNWHKNYKLLATYYKDQLVGDGYLENQLSSQKVQYRAELELLHNNVSQKIYDNYAFIPEAEYKYSTNVIEITASFLQWPFYRPSSQVSVTYGTTGHLFARMIFQAFDRNGIQYDENGVKSISWFSNDMAIYEERTACIIKTYDQYIATNLTARQTVADDFSYTVGLQAAFQAYRNKMHNQRWPSQNGERDKLFFRAYANMFCQFTAPTYVQDIGDSCRLRVNFPLSNLPEFSDVFNCYPGQPMSPRTKCEFWET